VHIEVRHEKKSVLQGANATNAKLNGDAYWQVTWFCFGCTSVTSVGELHL